MNKERTIVFGAKITEEVVLAGLKTLGLIATDKIESVKVYRTNADHPNRLGLCVTLKPITNEASSILGSVRG